METSDEVDEDIADGTLPAETPGPTDETPDADPEAGTGEVYVSPDKEMDDESGDEERDTYMGCTDSADCLKSGRARGV